MGHPAAATGGKKLKSLSAHDLVSAYLSENLDRLYRLAFRYVKNEQDAMDIAQEAAVKLLRSAGKIKNPDYIGTMAYRVVVNCSIDFLRKQKRETIGLPEVERGAEDDHGKLCALDLLDVLDQKAKTIVEIGRASGRERVSSTV